jgi:hypothetical protein
MFECTVAIDDTVLFNIHPTKADNRNDKYRVEAEAHHLDRSEIQATWVSVRDIAASTDDDRNTTDGDEMCTLSFIDRYIIYIYIYLSCCFCWLVLHDRRVVDIKHQTFFFVLLCSSKCQVDSNRNGTGSSVYL